MSIFIFALRISGDGKKEEDIETYRHENETRKNVVPVGLASYDTSKPKPKKYEYDPHLDPQIVWTGKAENTSLFIIRLEVWN